MSGKRNISLKEVPSDICPNVFGLYSHMGGGEILEERTHKNVSIDYKGKTELPDLGNNYKLEIGVSKFLSSPTSVNEMGFVKLIRYNNEAKSSTLLKYENIIKNEKYENTREMIQAFNESDFEDKDEKVRVAKFLQKVYEFFIDQE